MLKYVITALLVFTVYVSFTGSTSPYTLLTGIVVSVVLSVSTSRYIVVDEKKLLEVGRFLHLVFYFIKYMTIIEMKAHYDVVKRIFTMDIKPGIVKVPIRVNSRYARLLVMGSITNTPGTVVVDEKDNYFYVNWINVLTDRPEVASEYISREFEEYAYKVFE